MENLAIILRSLQLAAHSYHNLIKGESFFADHSFLGDLYGAYESAYDSVIERMIGTKGLHPAELLDIQKKAVDLLKTVAPIDVPKNIFETLLEGEKRICFHCAQINGSLGTMNLVAQLADDSEVRIYKMQQRLSK